VPGGGHSLHRSRLGRQDGFSPLIISAQNGHAGVIRLLLDNQANIDLQTKVAGGGVAVIVVVVAGRGAYIGCFEGASIL